MSARTFNIVVLSSSPPAAPELYLPSSPLNNAAATSPPRRVVMSASPVVAPSPLVSPQKKTSDTSKSASRKASILPDAVRGFATVGSLVRSRHFAPKLDDDTTDIEPPKPCQNSVGPAEEATAPTKKKSRARPAQSVQAEKTTKSKPKPRARRAKIDLGNALPDPELRLPVPRISPYFANKAPDLPKEDLGGAQDAAPKLTKAGKPRKPRAKKEKVEGSTTEPKPKKPRATRSKATDAASEIPEDSSIWEIPQSPRPKKRQPAKQQIPDPVADGLQLDEAVSRRRDWTPPKDTAIASPLTDSVGKENKQLNEDENSAQFSHMISNFTYAQPAAQNPSTAAKANKEPIAATKRRRIELVHGVGQEPASRESSPEKGKAPKKKPRTITDIATERYIPKDPIPHEPDVTESFFEPRTTTKKIPLNDLTDANANDLPKKPAQKRSTSKADSDKVGLKGNSKKASSKPTAKPKVVAEKLLSPGSALVRMNKQDILFGTSSQLALEESPTMVRQLQLAIKGSEADAEDSLHQGLVPPPQWPKLSKVEGKRGLWNAGTRDDKGGFLEHEDNVYIPEFDRTQDLPLLMGGVNDEPHAGPPNVRDANRIESPSAILISSGPPTPQHESPQARQALPNVKSPPHISTTESSFLDIDDFQPPPSNQDVNVSKSAYSPPQPKKSNSAAFMAPSKGSGRFVDIEEILDSEDEALAVLSPTPPRSRKPQDSEPLPLFSLSPSRPDKKARKAAALPDASIVQIYKIPTTHLTWDGIKPSICTSITTHIRSLPATTNPGNPSWHEKVLMYDPIVLEDFTTYLNTKTTIRTFKKATQKQIKAWNKKMKTEGGDEMGVVEWEDQVLAVETELECFQVRDWCESMSVCCIWGQGRGRGGGSRKGLY